MADISKYSGAQKAAVVLVTLGDKFTTEIFSKMDKSEIVAVSKALLEIEIVSKEEVQEIMKEYNNAIIFGAETLVGGADEVKRILGGSVDNETAKYIMDTLDLNSGPTPFEELEDVSPRILAQILRNEHPQTLALILGHLHPEKAAELIQFLPAGVRAEILMRLARLEAVAEDMLLEVERVLQSQLIAMGGKEGRKVGGVTSVAEILNSVDRATEEEVLSEIEEESTQLAESIRNLMFVFEDIKAIDDKGIREVLKEIGTDELVVALKGASDELSDKFLGNMSERAGSMVREDLEIMGPVKLSDVENAQQNIVKVVRRLEEEGRIMINRGGSDVFL